MLFDPEKNARLLEVTALTEADLYLLAMSPQYLAVGRNP